MTTALAERLRSAGLKATTPRIAILEELASDRRHPSAEMILESLQDRFPSLSLSTVYHTLETFIRKGLVRRITTAGGRLRVDGTEQDHDHAVCKSCGEVFDVARGVIRRPRPPERLPNGLKVENLYIEYEVTCPRCSTDT